MKKLTAKQRNGLSPKQFALPGGRYPINDASHARNALSRAAANATPAEQATIKRKVRARYPAIEVGGQPTGYANGGAVERKEPVLKTIPPVKDPRPEPVLGKLPDL